VVKLLTVHHFHPLKPERESLHWKYPIHPSLPFKRCQNSINSSRNLRKVNSTAHLIFGSQNVNSINKEMGRNIPVTNDNISVNQSWNGFSRIDLSIIDFSSVHLKSLMNKPLQNFPTCVPSWGNQFPWKIKFSVTEQISSYI
jgi:hypothetical protein